MLDIEWKALDIISQEPKVTDIFASIRWLELHMKIARSSIKRERYLVLANVIFAPSNLVSFDLSLSRIKLDPIIHGGIARGHRMLWPALRNLRIDGLKILESTLKDLLISHVPGLRFLRLSSIEILHSEYQEAPTS